MRDGSEVFLRCSVDSLAEDGTRDWTIDNIERIHDAFDPGLVNVHHELAYSFFGLSAVGIAGQQGTLSSSDRRMGTWGQACRI